MFSSPSFSILTQKIIFKNFGVEAKFLLDIVLNDTTWLGFWNRWIQILYNIFKIQNGRFNMALKMSKIYKYLEPDYDCSGVLMSLNPDLVSNF